MKTLNKVMLLGTVGKDPLMRQTSNGALCASLSLATESRYKDSAGQWQSKTQWHRLTAWSKLAEIVRDWVKKGDPLHIEGSIEYREHEGKYYTDIRVSDLILLGGKSERKTVSATNPAPGVEQVFPESDESDVPF